MVYKSEIDCKVTTAISLLQIYLKRYLYLMYSIYK